MSQILLHVGYGKSGSTYLQKWFESHPALYFQPKHKAGGFYHAWELAKHIQETGKAPENFVFSCEDLLVWKSEPYLYGYTGAKPYNYRQFQDEMCTSLHGIFPTAKVLIVTRGYESIFKSIYSHYLAMTGTLPFEDFLKSFKELFITMHDYNYVINAYRQKFGADNVILLPFELLRDDPAKFRWYIEKAMNIQDPFDFNPGRVNSAYSGPVLMAHFKVSRVVYNMLKPFPWAWREKLYVRYTKWVRRIKPHPFMVFVSKFMSKETVSWHGMNEFLALARGNADILKNEELYQPYLKEYLI